MTSYNRYLEKIAEHEDIPNAIIGGGLGLGAGLISDYIPDTYKVKRFLPNSKLTGAVGGAVSNMISGRIGDAVLKKQAADEEKYWGPTYGAAAAAGIGGIGVVGSNLMHQKGILNSYNLPVGVDQQYAKSVLPDNVYRQLVDSQKILKIGKSMVRAAPLMAATTASLRQYQDMESGDNTANYSRGALIGGVVGRYAPTNRLTTLGGVMLGTSAVAANQLRNLYMNKQATEQDLRDYASDYSSYQEPILKNVLTGASVGGFGGTVLAMPKVVDKIVKMKAIVNTPDQLAKATEASGKIVGKYGRIGSLAGAGAGLAWGVKSHLAPHKERVADNAHIDGVVEYSKRHIDPKLGAIPSAVAGGYIANKLSSKIPLPANPMLRTAVSLAPGLVGAVLGEKLGLKGMNAYNDYVLNDVRSKYYE